MFGLGRYTGVEQVVRGLSKSGRASPSIVRDAIKIKVLNKNMVLYDISTSN